jgi:hypothetical protein
MVNANSKQLQTSGPADERKASKTAAPTAYPGLEKPVAAAPARTECSQPAAFTPGPASYQAGPMPTIDGPEFYLAAEIWAEDWPAAHNHELWNVGPDGTYSWRSQADGVF